ncbi:unnamed protein product [Peronospora belbahrii]|uniref:Uncharacterized protein n=1 Tax=Peronospora belbahrii TaxID=622444 RepID=A0AAU9KQ21_9STRA|nr:unnamed protein product [Peronospora belbahrii]CAH0474933.1 unnamed protein product [Peronospora belbahrii]
MDFAGKVARFCHLEFVDPSRPSLTSSSYKHTNRVYIYQERLQRFVVSPELRSMTNDVEKAWVKYPAPPPGLNGTDIVILMLCSMSYTINPISFPWEGATHLTFQRLWRLIERMSLDSGSRYLISALESRCALGYSTYYDIAGDPMKDEPDKIITRAGGLMMDLRRAVTRPPTSMCSASYMLDDTEVISFLAVSTFKKT